MKIEEYPIMVQGSRRDTKLTVYVQENSEKMAVDKRPLILICPGGGYSYTSDREADPVAMQFLAMGYHAAVLRYSCAPSRYPTALMELAESMLLIRKFAGEWHVDPNKIVLEGASAGGHLAACLGVYWDEDFLCQKLGLSPTEHELLKPNGMILCYPVITAGKFAHKASFENLLGDQEQELAMHVSLEMHVTSKTPKAFIWGTFEDGSVPLENSILMVTAMRRAEVPVEYHLFPRGGHGLALATKQTQGADGKGVQEDCAIWIDLAHTWLERLFEETDAKTEAEA